MDNLEKELIYTLAERLIGVSQQGQYRKNILVQNVFRRMEKVGVDALRDYLIYVKKDEREFAKLLSALTIHTTSWFREVPHFEHLKEYVHKNLKIFSEQPLKILSVACSTGEEVYSLALMMQSIKNSNPKFNYSIIGVDIDPECITTCINAVYDKKQLTSISNEYHKFLCQGQNRLSDYFAVSKEIRRNCSFKVGSLISRSCCLGVVFDVVFCRNVLIYFSPDSIHGIITKLASILNPKGILTLGHSEALLTPERYSLKGVWNSTYIHTNVGDRTHVSDKKEEMESETVESKAHDRRVNLNKKIKILIVDDSPTIRSLLRKTFIESGYEVLIASNADEATEVLDKNIDDIDLISLDIHMPGKRGDVWLKEQRAKGLKIPVIIITDTSEEEATDVLGALESGAQDYLPKVQLKKRSDTVERVEAIIAKFRKSEQSHVAIKRSKNSQELFRPEIIICGASTGGTDALSRLLRDFSKDSPPIIVVQHISPSFAFPFAARLARTSGLKLGESKDGEILKSGHIYLALNDYHVGVKSRAGIHRLVTSSKSHVNRHRPSVDFAFDSAENVGDRVAGVLLTGMGRDGAMALAKLKKKGAITFVQDEKTSVVFGMPGSAIKLGADGFVGTTTEIREQLNLCLNKYK